MAKKQLPGQMQKVKWLGQPAEPEKKPKNEPEKLAKITDAPKPEPWDARMTQIRKEKERWRKEFWKNKRRVQYSLPEDL